MNNINNATAEMAITQSAWAKYGVSASELLEKPVEAIPCLLEPLLPRVGIACLAGGSDTGKSSFLRNLCMFIVAAVSNFLGFKINAVHYKAIYVSSEDDEDSINCLLNKQNKELGLTSSQLEGLTFIFDTHNLLGTLDEMLTEQPVDIVVIDAFGDLFDKGNINDSTQVRLFLNEYFKLAQKHQCLITFLHHFGKGKEDAKPSKNNSLGSQGIEAKMRIVLNLVNDHVEAGNKHLCVVKGNYLPTEFKNESFKLRFTENMVYENTGERVPFEHLGKKDDDGLAKYEKAKELKDNGMKLEDIAKEIGYANKGNVSKLFKKFEAKDS